MNVKGLKDGNNANTKWFLKNQCPTGLNLNYVMNADKALFTVNYYNVVN